MNRVQCVLALSLMSCVGCISLNGKKINLLEKDKPDAGTPTTSSDSTGSSSSSSSSSSGTAASAEVDESVVAAFCKTLDYDDETPRGELVRRQQLRAIAGCREDFSDDWLFWIDRKIEISQVSRYGLLRNCLDGVVRDLDSEDADKEVRKPRSLGKYAACSADIALLDAAKFATEIKTAKFPPAIATAASATFAAFAGKLKQLNGIYQKAYASNEEMKRLLFATAAKAFTDWNTLYMANKAAYDTAIEWEAKSWAGSKKVVQGCRDQVHPLMLTHIATAKPADEKALIAAMSDPIGFRLALTLLTCDAFEDQIAEGSAIKEALERQREYRGPRYFAYWAVIDVITEIAKDQENFKVDKDNVPDLPSRDVSVIYNRVRNSYTSTVQGQISGLKKTDTSVKVSFKAIKWSEPTYACKRTNRISSIGSDGTLYYEENCRVNGSEQKSSVEEPVTIDEKMAVNLAAGQHATFKIGGDGRVAVPWLTYKDSGKKKLLTAFGAAL
jgi:hypothetical protein